MSCEGMTLYKVSLNLGTSTLKILKTLYSRRYPFPTLMALGFDFDHHYSLFNLGKIGFFGAYAPKNTRFSILLLCFIAIESLALKNF